jgi:chloramphenicol 3-O-phosphotransferase
VALAVATFVYVPHPPCVVGLEMWTVTLAPEARSPNEHVRVLLEIAQLAAAVPPSMLHVIPVPVGSGSLSVTLVAVPGPVLLTVMPKPIGEPALTDALSAVFVMWRLGHSTVVEAEAWTCAWFVACAEAVFGYAAQLANVVALVT